MKSERSLVGVIYIYIKGRSVCACFVHALAISVYQLLTNEQQISCLWAFYGRNYGLSFPATPGTSRGLNLIPIQFRHPVYPFYFFFNVMHMANKLDE